MQLYSQTGRGQRGGVLLAVLRDWLREGRDQRRGAGAGGVEVCS
jgi:hypothetical protein